MFPIAPRWLVFIFAPRWLVFMALALLVACQTRAPEPTAPVAPAAPPSPPRPAVTAPPPPVAVPAPPPPPPSPAPRRGEPPPQAPAQAPALLFVGVAKANLRAAPNTKAKILDVLSKGTKLIVVSHGNQWYRVRLDDGTEGWVAESVVTSNPLD